MRKRNHVVPVRVECKGTSASGRTGGKEWTKQGGIFTFPDLRRTASDKAL